MPMASASTVSRGSMIRVARRRGTTSLRTGSAPMERRASTCSVTVMDPSSAAMPEPDAAADHERREHRPQLPHEGQGDDLADVEAGAELGQGVGRLEGEHHAREQRGDVGQIERADADAVELAEDLLKVEREASPCANHGLGPARRVAPPTIHRRSAARAFPKRPRTFPCRCDGSSTSKSRRWGVIHGVFRDVTVLDRTQGIAMRQNRYNDLLGGLPMRVVEGHLDASGLRFAVVVSRFNEALTSRLESGADGLS
jgi:hypothetical protein